MNYLAERSQLRQSQLAGLIEEACQYLEPSEPSATSPSNAMKASETGSPIGSLAPGLHRDPPAGLRRDRHGG